MNISLGLLQLNDEEIPPVFHVNSLDKSIQEGHTGKHSMSSDDRSRGGFRYAICAIKKLAWQIIIAITQLKFAYPLHEYHKLHYLTSQTFLFKLLQLLKGIRGHRYSSNRHYDRYTLWRRSCWYRSVLLCTLETHLQQGMWGFKAIEMVKHFIINWSYLCHVDMCSWWYTWNKSPAFFTLTFNAISGWLNDSTLLTYL